MNENTKGPSLSNKILLFVLIFVLLLALVTVSYAWIGTLLEVHNENFSGSSITAYFAGGDGSAKDPYQITDPVHVYNLAWLQYLGIFNRDEDQDGKIDQQYYFVVNNDVDMNGLIIPPIGTEENPFIGNFNGKGHCISGAIISNYVSETDGDGGIEQMPSVIEEIDTTITVDGTVQSNKSIVGFFGVIGDWDYTLKVENTVNKVYDLRLDRLTVRTDTDQSLIGLLAGYVNASVVNVGIGESSIVIGESVVPLTGVKGIDVQLMVSRFSLIGDYDEENVVWPDEPILGGFGDSIALKDMYNQLQVAFKAKKEFEFLSAKEYTYVDGVQTNYKETFDSTAELQRVDWGSAGNYVFSVRDDGETDYTYLYGDTLLTVTEKYYTTRSADYFYSGSHYLSLNSSNQVASETAQQAAAWSFDEQGHLYTKIENQSGGSTVYYLNRNSSGNLTASTSADTIWVKEAVSGTQGRLYCTVNGTKYYVYDDSNSGSWRLETVGRSETTTTGYTISKDGSYLNLSESGAITCGADANTATLWSFSNDSSKSGKISATTASGTVYYLMAQQSNYSYSLTTTTSSSSATSWSNSSNMLSYRFSFMTTRYVSLSGSSWTLSRNGTTLTFSDKQERVEVEEWVESDFNISLSQDNTVQDLTETVTYREKAKDTNATWFPLAIEEDQDGNKAVSAANTGYVVSGSDYQHPSDAPQRSGNIRVSRHPASAKLTNSWDEDTNSLSHNILSVSYKTYGDLEDPTFSTIDSTNNAEDTFGFTRYGESFEKLKATIDNDKDGYVYGLHFMQATIHEDDIIEIDGARVLTEKGNQVYPSGYQLPRNAITFNLPEAGYINFFAGTYFVSTLSYDKYENTTFFSLYQIFRKEDGKTLKAIKEIAEIYGKLGSDDKIDEAYSYVYKYEDGSFSEEKPDDYVLVFSCDWIRDAVKIGMQNSFAYYFEIPVNSGEFALGSVEGEDGAYLIYLDLAANGTRRVSTTAAHTMTGVNFVDDAGLTSSFDDIQDYPIVAIGVAFDGTSVNHGEATVSYNRTSEANMTYHLSGSGGEAFDLTFMGKNVTFAEANITVNQLFSFDGAWQRRRRPDELLWSSV